MISHIQNIQHQWPSNKLNVIAVVSNPIGYHSRYRLFKQFIQHMSTFDINLIIVEHAYGARDFVVTESNNPNHVQVRSSTAIWLKESLINQGFKVLPSNWQYAAWIDGDIAFLNPNWVHDTLHQLQVHPVVQLWQTATDMGPTGEVVQIHHSFGSEWIKGITTNLGFAQYGSKNFPHPGFAWAITREAYNSLGGLIDWAILGSGDHHMALALIKMADRSVPGGIHANYLDKLMAFQERGQDYIKGNIGYVNGTIVHNFHGSKAKRRYIERWDILVKNKFDPNRDIILDHQGIYYLHASKIELRDQILAYLASRNEDETCI